MTTEGPDREIGEDAGHQAGVFTRCSRCSMEVRRSEVEAHLAHSHDIGPTSAKKPRGDREGRGPRRNFGDR